MAGEPRLDGRVGELIAVSWYDAHADAKAELSLDEINTIGSYKFTTYGILVRDDRNRQISDPVVAIAAEQGEDGRYRGVTFIPAGMVYSVKYLGNINGAKTRRPNKRKIEVDSQITKSGYPKSNGDVSELRASEITK